MIRIVCADAASADVCIYRGLYEKVSDPKAGRTVKILAPEPDIRYFYRTLGTDYSLILCTEDPAFETTLLDVQQLL